MTNEENKLNTEEKAVPVQNTATLADMPGVSQATKNTLSTMPATSAPTKAVTAALGELNSVIARQPKEFRSNYYDQLSGVMNNILGRKAFSYDMASDPMYKMYRESYTSAGKRAMEDTMGRAAAMTGGYGSSYSATAGQQAYNSQLGALNDRLPELYQMSRSAYDAEGDALRQQYEMLNDAYQQEYGAYQDEFDRWLSERQAAQQRYDSELDAQLTMDKLQQQQENADREYFYELAMDMLELGRTPSVSVLRSAGFSEEDIAALTAKKKSSSSSSKKKTASAKSASSANSAGKTAFTDLLSQAMKARYKAAKLGK